MWFQPMLPKCRWTTQNLRPKTITFIFSKDWRSNILSSTFANGKHRSPCITNATFINHILLQQESPDGVRSKHLAW